MEKEEGIKWRMWKRRKGGSRVFKPRSRKGTCRKGENVGLRKHFTRQFNFFFRTP